MGDKPDVKVPPLQENTVRRLVGNGWAGEGVGRGGEGRGNYKRFNRYCTLLGLTLFWPALRR